MYRERNGDPVFWAEPMNALTNASFIFAVAFALDFAIRQCALNPNTLILIAFAGVKGCGSFPISYITILSLAAMFVYGALWIVATTLCRP